MITLRLWALLLALSVSPIRIAVTPAPTAGELVSTSAIAYLKAVTRLMPAWKEDILAPYEAEQIADVETDIQAANQAQSEVDFLVDIAQLHRDANILQALDETLQKRMVI